MTIENVRLPARMENLEPLIRFVSEFLRANGLSGETIPRIEMAAEEVVVNVIRYAYPGGEPGEVEIRGRAESDDALILEFEDHGVPFDPTTLSSPEMDVPVSEKEVGGLGVFLVRRMVNELRYRREGDRNILTFVVRKSGVES